MERSEHQEQCEVIKWRDQHSVRWPGELELLHAIPNGGKRSARTGKSLKDEGVLKSIPDLFLPVPRLNEHSMLGFHPGMYVEMKKIGRVPRPDQLEMLRKLSAVGFRCFYFDNAADCIAEIEKYLNFPRLEKWGI